MHTPKSSRPTAARGEVSDGLEWKILSREVVSECRIFSVQQTVAANDSEQGIQGKFFTLNCGPWVNVIPLTDDGHVVMVEQYRHGVEDITLEIPGGSIDDSDIDSEAAAVRELREETGCIAKQWFFLGKNHPNPALQNNLCFTHLAEGVRRVEEPQFDSSGTERTRVRYVPLDEVDSLIARGTISHALVIVAFHFLRLHRPDLIAKARRRKEGKPLGKTP